MPETSVVNSNGDENHAECSSKKAEIRIKNVSEINEDAANDENQNPAQKKRRLPSWMTKNSSNNESSPNKRVKCDENDNNDVTSNNQKKVFEKESTPNLLDENYEVANEESTTNAAEVNKDNTNAVPSVEPEQTADEAEINTNTNQDITTTDTSKDETVTTSKIKNEPIDINDAAASTSTGHQTYAIKPAVKVEKADASSISRESCKYGIRCYRRNPMHRIEEAHPGDNDYKRPHFPPPPAGTPDCPYGDLCYRRNPTHFQQYNHPDNTDFEQNYRKYCLRQRRQRQQQQNSNDSDDSDDYDLDDPFINDDSDLDYVPTDDGIEDTEELDYDDCDKAEE